MNKTVAHKPFSHTTHGLYYTRLHGIWTAMKSRCYNRNNKRYKTYGARNIVVCDEWNNDYKSFYDWSIANGYNNIAKRGECTLDRIDNNKNYCPENCRWTSIKTQNRNRTNTRFVEYKGRKISIGELAEELGCNYKSLWGKLKRNNWDTSILN